MKKKTKLIILIITMFTFSVSLPIYFHYWGIIGLIINGIMFFTLVILSMKTIESNH